MFVSPVRSRAVSALWPLGLAVLAALFLAACATTPSAVKANPDAVRNQVVTITGTIGNQVSLPGFNLSLMSLDDEDASLALLARGQYRSGQTLTLKARVVAPITEVEGRLPPEAVELRQKLVEQGLLTPLLADTIFNGVWAALKSLSAGGSRLILLVEEEAK